MTKRVARFRQADLQRALRGAKAAGLKVARVEIGPENGKIVIITDAETGQLPQSSLEQWKARHVRAS
jgi:hypothetical protein